MRPAPAVPHIEGVDAARALLEYRGAARELVARLKYRNQRAAIDWLAGGMAELVNHHFDALTWAPANRRHVRQRGFDHGQLLASSLAYRLGTRCVALLDRDDDAPLTGRAAAQRQVVLRVTAEVPAAVLIVDDVITSGATLRAGARVLRLGGAGAVFGVSAAYTPPPGHGPDVFAD